MFRENKKLKRLLDLGRVLVPKKIFTFAQPVYHWVLAIIGGIIYGFPSQSLEVIAITGTKGKSSVVFMVTKIIEGLGLPVASVSSLGYKIKDKEWPNLIKMTTPGRTKLQKFLYMTKKSGVKYVVLEATSEGIAQNRLAGIKIGCAVFTGIHPEHIESHGSFDNYLKSKQKLFLKTKKVHIINIDDPNFEKFINIPSGKRITFGMESGDINQKNLGLSLKLRGEFNIYNALASLGVISAYDLDINRAKKILEEIDKIPGRMEFIRKGQPFDVVIDYAHTPDSLELVYKTLKPNHSKLICVLGATGGGRDKWKRQKFGQIASNYCDEIFLTNEDPYDEAPENIINQVASGISEEKKFNKIIDRKEAIEKAISLATDNDVVVITGKGSEISMAVKDGDKIPWSDKGVVEEILKNIYS